MRGWRPGVELLDLDDPGPRGEDVAVITLVDSIVPCASKARLDRREAGRECGGERGSCGESDGVAKVSVVERGEDVAATAAERLEEPSSVFEEEEIGVGMQSGDEGTAREPAVVRVGQLASLEHSRQGSAEALLVTRLRSSWPSDLAPPARSRPSVSAASPRAS